jgi:hypothetical protein
MRDMKEHSKSFIIQNYLTHTHTHGNNLRQERNHFQFR